MSKEIKLSNVADSLRLSENIMFANSILDFVNKVAYELYPDGALCDQDLIEQWEPGDPTTKTDNLLVYSDKTQNVQFEIDIEFGLNIDRYNRDETEVGLGKAGEVESIEIDHVHIEQITMHFDGDEFVIKYDKLEAQLIQELSE